MHTATFLLSQWLAHSSCKWQWQVGYALTKVPEGFTLHKVVKRVYERRRQMIDSGEGIEWGSAEALAFGTLLSEGAASSGGTKESSHVP